MPYEDSIKQKSGLVQLQAWPFYDPRSVLNFGRVVEVKPGGTDKLLSLLKYQFPEPDWKFVRVGGLKGEPEPVPESTSAFGILALSAWAIVKALKIRFDKQP